MNNKEFYRNNIPDDVPFFSKSLWLDFICPDKWDVAIVKNNNELKAAMPYMVNNLVNPTKIIMPPFTKFLGPYLNINKLNPSSFNTEEINLLSELENQLPNVKYYRQSWHPQQMNCLPFLWNGYMPTIKYCYIIKALNSVDLLWKTLSQDARALIKKAGNKKFKIIQNDDPEKFNYIINKIYEKQKLTNPYNPLFICRLQSFINANKSGYTFFVCDSHNNELACALVLFDNNSYYLFAGGADPRYSKDYAKGVTSYLVWSLIEKAVSEKKDFNFLGSIVESKERFIRSFGGKILPYLDIIKENTLAHRVKKRLKSMLIK